MLKNFLIKLIGKKLDAKLEKWGISKAKVTGILAVILPLVTPISTALGHPIIITPEIYAILGGFGLWALREGSNTDAVLASTAVLNKELEGVVKS